MSVYGLVRVSTIGQKENTSLSFQIKRIKDYCNLFSLPLTDIVKETESGAKSMEDRTGLSKLNSLIDSGDCKTIIVNKIDRLGRSLLQGLLFLKHCEEHSVRVVSISESIDTIQPQSKLLINILWSIAEHERDMISSRLSDGRDKKFLDGNKPFGKTPFGYKKNHKGMIVVDSEESKVIQYIYKRHNELSRKTNLTKTKKTQMLLRSLKMKGYSFRDSDFKHWNVKKILSNPFYCGVMVWKGKSIKHNYESIISKRLYNKIND